MCGLVGILAHGRGNKVSRLVLATMTDTLSHRGPDDKHVWIDRSSALGMGHRRLSIIDLSGEGRQPMVSESGRYVIAYNGEVYNFRELRRKLERKGTRFRGHSDTEVVLAAIEAWGLEAAVRRFVGMFAFALWDTQERRLNLVRDRVGIKPLYYGWVDGGFVFASELKAIRGHPGFRGEIDRSSVALLVQYGYVPSPYAIYEGIRKVPAGQILTVVDGRADEEPVSTAYWSAREVVEGGAVDSFRGSQAEALARLGELLGQAVENRLIADVPLGAFLSGGIDSSTVVALMQTQSGQPVKTFSIGYHEQGYNEAEHAKAVAAHLGTEHTELYVTAEEAQAVIPELPQLYDEPFCDVSQIPTYLVSKLARKQVKVALSGDGGDELFGGYRRHLWGERIQRRIGRVPAPMRRLLATSLAAVPSSQWTRLHDALADVMPDKFRIARFGDAVHKLADTLAFDNTDALYRELVSHWKKPSDVVLGAAERPSVYSDPACAPALGNFASRMMYMDLVGYLPDDILTKLDRASMSVSLEARVPMLDHRVVEFVWKLPLNMKIRNGQSKWILRQLLYKYVPERLVERPKMGFSVPIDSWLRGPLRDWAEALLAPERLRREGFFEAAAVREKWSQHLTGKRNWDSCLWNVLMFQSWREAQETDNHRLSRKLG